MFVYCQISLSMCARTPTKTCTSLYLLNIWSCLVEYDDGLMWE